MFRMSIREVLLVTTLVAVAIGWYLDRSALSRRENGWRSRAEILASLMSEDGQSVTWQFDGSVSVAYPEKP